MRRWFWPGKTSQGSECLERERSLERFKGPVKERERWRIRSNTELHQEPDLVAFVKQGRLRMVRSCGADGSRAHAQKDAKWHSRGSDVIEGGLV